MKKYKEISKKVSMISTLIFTILLFSILVANSPMLSIWSYCGAFILCLSIASIFGYVNSTVIRQSKRIFSCTIFQIIHIFSVVVLILCLARPSIAWDTWQMYDTSKYVFSDFGYMSQIRQHITNTHYEMSFPPLFPSLIHIINFVCNMGVNASVYINCAATLLLEYKIFQLSQRVNHEIEGSLCAAIFFLGSLYNSTFVWGLSNSLGWLFLASIIYTILSSEKYSTHTTVQCALWAGLGLINRFDFLSIVIVLPIVILVIMIHQHFALRRIILQILSYLGIVLIIISPWIIYSEIHFQKFFITDNGRRLFNIEDTRPSTFFSNDDPAKTIWDNFGQWLVSFIGRIITACKGLGRAIISTMIVEAAFLAIVNLSGKRQKRQTNNWRETIHNNINNHYLLLLSIVIIMTQELLVILTGYEDARYHFPFVFTVQFLLIVLCTKEGRLLALSRKLLVSRPRTRCMLILFFILLIGGEYLRIGYIRNPSKEITAIIKGNGYKSMLNLSSDEQSMADYLSYDCQCLCLYRDETGYDFLKFSALSNISSIISPSNLNERNVKPYVNTFEINYLLCSDIKTQEIFKTEFELITTPYRDLFRLVSSNQSTN